MSMAVHFSKVDGRQDSSQNDLVPPAIYAVVKIACLSDICNGMSKKQCRATVLPMICGLELQGRRLANEGVARGSATEEQGAKTNRRLLAAAGQVHNKAPSSLVSAIQASSSAPNFQTMVAMHVLVATLGLWCLV